MDRLLGRLKAEHERLEALLDTLLAALNLVGPATAVPDALRQAARAAAKHYSDEEEYLMKLAAGSPGVAAKMRQQHSEATEIAAHFEDALRENRNAEALTLARRFHAIAQHNIIEEERDVFPLRLSG